jgi:hypothetical protein
VINRKRRNEGYKAAAGKIKKNSDRVSSVVVEVQNRNVSNMCVRRVNAVKKVTLIDCCD